MADDGVSAAAAGSMPYPSGPLELPGASQDDEKKLTGLVAYRLWCDVVKKLPKGASIQQRQALFNEKLWGEYNVQPLVASLTQVLRERVGGDDLWLFDDPPPGLTGARMAFLTEPIVRCSCKARERVAVPAVQCQWPAEEARQVFPGRMEACSQRAGHNRTPRNAEAPRCRSEVVRTCASATGA